MKTNIEKTLFVLVFSLLFGGAILIWKNVSSSSAQQKESSSGESHQLLWANNMFLTEKKSLSSNEDVSNPVSHSSSHVTEVSPASEWEGMYAEASVRVGSKNFNLTPNESGLFPRVLVPANDKIQISVAYPEGDPGDSLVIQAEDGGLLDNGTVVKASKLDQNKIISFEFQTNGHDGTYRVTLRKGLDEKRLDFWVGEEEQLQKGS